jgi:hypothetical protein
MWQPCCGNIFGKGKNEIDREKNESVLKLNVKNGQEGENVIVKNPKRFLFYKKLNRKRKSWSLPATILLKAKVSDQSVDSCLSFFCPLQPS